MTPEERQLLSGLADRVKNTPVQQRDYEADQFLRQLAQEVPDTAYILAQTVIMQDFARRAAEEFASDTPAPQQAATLQAAPVPLFAHLLLWQVLKAKLTQFARWIGVVRA